MSLRGLLIAFLVVGIITSALIGSMVVADRYHLDFASMLLGWLGAGLIYGALVRPAWFWEHRGVAFIRSIIGPHLTTGFYSLLGLWAIGSGVVRAHMWAVDRQICRDEFAHAHGLAAVQAAEALVPHPVVPGYLTLFLKYDPESCGRHYDHGDLQ